MGVHIKAGNPRWLMETAPIEGSLPPSTNTGGGGTQSQGGWAPATQGPLGLLIISLITLLTVYLVVKLDARAL